MTIWQEIKDSYKWGSVLTRLIYINIGVFVLLRLIQAFFTFTTGPYAESSYPLLQWLSMPSNPLSLMVKPWTLVSYMFVHYQFLHVLFNVLYLYWFGKLFLEFLNSRRLLYVYFGGGILGGLVYLLAFNLVPSFYHYFPSGLLMGASASVMAILFAVAAYAPNHRVYLMFFGDVRLKYIALVAVIIDLISIPTLDNTGGHLAHLGGALFGYLYARSMAGKPVQHRHNAPEWKNPLVGLFKPKSKMKVTHRRPLTDMEYNAIKVKRQAEVDRILDKIKMSGYDSLTKDEKKVLFEASQER
ncbi:membrane associated rhomboid family serine protease [Breznakibacter xylanolyticus]|uniref:Membrane associated rhomboid family serine protease n=1 Tax=Breznakibacter xylanolyticus TaxID=990 RepID=A0A2W7NH75_9BACT|nr:rhomboid family intramembrane serine protease [Breznakibacter xylanolyticus]PZX19190.1 membrane associated rhomboid family serine protease [Breznakibacter xylanolyticus]